MGVRQTGQVNLRLSSPNAAAPAGAADPAAGFPTSMLSEPLTSFSFSRSSASNHSPLQAVQRSTSIPPKATFSITASHLGHLSVFASRPPTFPASPASFRSLMAHTPSLADSAPVLL